MRHRLIVMAGALACVVLIVGLAGWRERSDIAVWLAPSKTPSAHSSETARSANTKFWDALHGGHYEELPGVIETLTGAYVENPRDVETAAHIGFSHTWFYTEQARADRRTAAITDHIVLARKYFSEAARLSSDDQRLKGFLATQEIAEGTVDGNEKLVRRGYFDLMKAIEGWPEFNLFTAGYVMSRLPFIDVRYAEAVDYQWRNLDACAGERVDRSTLDYTKYMAQETTEGTKRACWNSWIAPHNFEGFFLNMGDMLVKQGELATAKRLYTNAKLARNYQQWPFKPVLEARIEHAAENVVLFRNPPLGEKTRTMMISSTFSCMGCHQQ